MTNFWSFSKFKQTFHFSIFLVHLFISLSSVDKPQIIFIIFYLLLYLFIYWIIQYLTVCETPDFYFLATVLGLLKKIKKFQGVIFRSHFSKKIENFHFFRSPKNRLFRVGPKFSQVSIRPLSTRRKHFHSISADLTLETYSQYSLLVLLNFCSHTETDKLI